MHRTHVTLVTLAAVMLAVGALSATLAGRAAGQSAPSETSSPPAASASLAPGDYTVEPFSNPVGGTGCEVEANNPHIATSDGPYRAKGFGKIFGCNEKKDYLWVKTTLWKKGNNGDTSWSVADRKSRDCRTCFTTGIGAERACANRQDNNFQTTTDVFVQHNGNSTDDGGRSRIVTLNCGGF